MNIAKRAGWPLRRLLNPRFQWIIDTIDDRLGSRGGGRPPLHQRLDAASQRMDAVQGELSALRALVEGLAAPLDAVQSEVHILRGQTEHEHKVVTESFEALRDRLIDLDRAVADVGSEYQIPPPDQRTVGDLRWPVAEFVNWATYQHGYAGQAGMWINNPVFVTVEPDGVRVRNVNERIVEMPFAFAALSGLERPSRILDIGGSESTIALSLASLGHDVTLVDPRGFPVEHPRLTVQSVVLDDLPEDEEPYDAVLAVSAIEHFGLGAYGLPDSQRRLDMEALTIVRRLLRPGGLLVLTVPFGAPSVDDFQRVYDNDGLDQLIDGWEVLERSGGWPTKATVWEAGPLKVPANAPGSHGVAMIVARRPND